MRAMKVRNQRKNREKINHHGTYHYAVSVLLDATICSATRKRGGRVFTCNPHEDVGCIILALCDFVIGVSLSLPVIARPAF